MSTEEKKEGEEKAEGEKEGEEPKPVEDGAAAPQEGGGAEGEAQVVTVQVDVETGELQTLAAQHHEAYQLL